MQQDVVYGEEFIKIGNFVTKTDEDTIFYLECTDLDVYYTEVKGDKEIFRIEISRESFKDVENANIDNILKIFNDEYGPSFIKISDAIFQKEQIRRIYIIEHFEKQNQICVMMVNSELKIILDMNNSFNLDDVFKSLDF